MISFIAPLVGIVILYLIVKYFVDIKKRPIRFVKIRPIIGGIASGFFLSLAVQQPTFREGISYGLLSVIFLFGAILQIRKNFG